MKKYAYLILAWPFLMANAHAEQIRLESGIDRSVMLELYTSEGCSSCPPAEEFLNGLTNHEQLWKKIIPVAFHVDYWNYLGWEDRFSQKKFAARQRWYARTQRARTVYTPAFFVNGQNWRPGYWRKTLPNIKTEPVGKLSLLLMDKTVTASFDSYTKSKQPLVLNVAIIGMMLTTQIRAGENEGRDARHEFVVLGHTQVRGDGHQWQTEIPTPKVKAAEYAIVAWLNTPHDPQPIQSVAGPIPRELLLSQK